MDTNKMVAAMAVQALASAVDSGNEEAISTMLEFLDYLEDHQDMMTQLAVIENCVKLPHQFHPRIVRRLADIYNGCRQERVRCAAKNTAGKLAEMRRQRRRRA